MLDVSRMLAFVAALAIGFTCGAEETDSTAGKSFAWVGQNMHFYDASRFGETPIREMLENGIVAGLEERGLRFVASLESADMELSYVAVLGNKATDEEITAFRQAHPDIAGLAEDPEEFEQGLLFAKLVDRRTREKVWENTYRGLVALDMPQAQRTERLNELIENFVSTYPP